MSLSASVLTLSLGSFGCAVDSSAPSQDGDAKVGTMTNGGGAVSDEQGSASNDTAIAPVGSLSGVQANPSTQAMPSTPVDAPGAAPSLNLEGTADANGFYHVNTGTVDYYLRLPKSYDKTKPYPMFIALHGCGDSAANFGTWAAAPPAARSTLGYIAVSVGGRDGGCWDVAKDGALVDSVMTHARARVYAHDQKVFIGGYSSGGALAYKYGLDHADKLAGILIENSGLYSAVGAGQVMGELQQAQWKIQIAHTANRGDTVFPLAEVQKDWQKMQSLGFPLVSTVQEGTHDGTANVWEALVTKVTTWQRAR